VVIDELLHAGIALIVAHANQEHLDVTAASLHPGSVAYPGHHSGHSAA
jgi:hypothetical protein